MGGGSTGLEKRQHTGARETKPARQDLGCEDALERFRAVGICGNQASHQV